MSPGLMKITDITVKQDPFSNGEIAAHSTIPKINPQPKASWSWVQSPPKNGLVWSHIMYVLVNGYISSWWFQPIWKICSSNWIISPTRGEHKKYLSCHHLGGAHLNKTWIPCRLKDEHFQWETNTGRLPLNQLKRAVLRSSKGLAKIGQGLSKRCQIKVQGHNTLSVYC